MKRYIIRVYDDKQSMWKSVDFINQFTINRPVSESVLEDFSRLMHKSYKAEHPHNLVSLVQIENNSEKMIAVD